MIAKTHKAGKGVIGMKLIVAGRFRDDQEKKDRSIQYVLGLGTVHVLNVGFEKTDQIDEFVAFISTVRTCRVPGRHVHSCRWRPA